MPNFDDIATFGDYNQYSYTALKFGHTEEQLREEYKKFRKEAKARYTRLRKSEFSDSKLLHGKAYLNRSPKNMTKAELARNLSDAARFVHSSLSTVTGQRRQKRIALEKWKMRGYDDVINNKTYKQFAKFMDSMQAQIKNKILTSDEIVEIFAKAVDNNISVANVIKNFEFYRENIDTIETLDLNTNRKRAYTRREIEEIFEKRGI